VGRWRWEVTDVMGRNTGVDLISLEVWVVELVLLHSKR